MTKRKVIERLIVVLLIIIVGIIFYLIGLSKISIMLGFPLGFSLAWLHDGYVAYLLNKK